MKIKPSLMRCAVRLFDDTPSVVLRNVVGVKQRLFSQIRYNRLVDRFFGAVAYSLGPCAGKEGKERVEIDEVYVAIDNLGRQIVVPVLCADGKNLRDVSVLHRVYAWCQRSFPGLVCRPILVQFMTPVKIVMFALAMCDGEIKITEECHYELVLRDTAK